MKLIDSLIGGEIAPLSPTQLHGQGESVVVSGKGQDVNNAETKDASKVQKNPKDSSEPRGPNDEQSGGLLAMMATVPTARTKPTLLLDFGRSAVEDSFVKSPKNTEGQYPLYAPTVSVVQPQAAVATQMQSITLLPTEVASPAPVGRVTPKESDLEFTPIVPISFSGSKNQSPAQDQALDPATGAVSGSVQAAAATVPLPVPVPASTPAPIADPVAIPISLPIFNDAPAKDRHSAAPDRPRPNLELSNGSRQDPAIPLALGKVRTEGPASTEPIAFAARLTEREEPEDSQFTKPSMIQRSEKQPSLTGSSQPKAQEKADPENVPTNPKPNSPVRASQPSSEPATPKSKPVVAEHAAESVPTNPKSPAASAVPARETPAQGPQSSTKSTSAPEVRGSAPTQETELQAKPTIRSEPAREISIQIPSADGGKVDVQIVERDGKVQVTVRGSDTQLNSALRGELAELVHTLDQKGYKTETWTPGDTYPMTSAEAPDVKSPARSESSPDWSGNQSKDGGSGGNPGGNQQQRRQQQERPDWLIELERRLDTEG